MRINLLDFILLIATVAVSQSIAKADTAAEVTLPQLAINQFGDISLAERRLLSAAADGYTADCASLSGDDRKIRGELFAWLCINPQATAHLTHRGISITGAEVVSVVDLEWAKIAFPIVAADCAFKDGIDCANSHIAFLNLTDSILTDLKAGEVHIEGSIYLERVTVTGRVTLQGAIIDGDLHCDGGQLICRDGTPALDANSAEVKGSVYLCNGFKAEGGVNFAGAKVGRELNFAGGRFVGQGATPALYANRANVKGDVLLCNYYGREGVSGFKADGEVNLLAAIIEGNLYCDDGEFIGKDKAPGLNIHDVEVRNNVFLRKANAQGGVDLGGARIDGNLECTGGTFVANSTLYALNAYGAKIGGNVYLSGRFKAEGNINFFGASVGRAFRLFDVQSPERVKLDLRQAKVETLLNSEGSWPTGGELYVDGFVYDQIDGRTRPNDDQIEDRVGPNAEMQLRWLQLQPQNRFLSQPFEQLASVLRKMGLEEDARKVMIAKNEEHARYVQGQPEWLWYGLFGHLIGYGYAPWRAFGISLVIVLLGWAVFRNGYCRGLITPTEGNEYMVENNEAQPASKDYPKFNAFVYSLEAFVPLVRLGIADRWEPNSNRNAFFVENSPLMTGGWLRGYLWLHMISGWVLSALWISG